MKQQEKKIHTALLAVGFSNQEAKVYLVALQATSPQSVLALSRATGIARSTLYDVLVRMENHGFVKKIVVRGGMSYEAVSPTMLRKDFTDRETIFLEAWRTMEHMEGAAYAKPAASVYEGTDGMVRLWRRILNSGVLEYSMITNGFTFLDFVKEGYLVKRMIADRVKKGVKSRQLLPMSSFAKRIVEKDTQELRESRFLPKDVSFPVSVIIFGHEVAFLTTRRENAAIVVMSGETALTFRMLFELLWSQAADPGYTQ